MVILKYLKKKLEAKAVYYKFFGLHLDNYYLNVSIENTQITVKLNIFTHKKQKTYNSKSLDLYLFWDVPYYLLLITYYPLK